MVQLRFHQQEVDQQEHLAESQLGAEVQDANRPAGIAEHLTYVEDGVPFIKPLLKWTPAAHAVCSCGLSFMGRESTDVKTHFRKKHSVVLVNLTGYKKYACDSVTEARSNPIGEYIADNEVPKLVPQCKNCGRFFANRKNLNDHTKNTNNPCKPEDAVWTPAVKLICGTYYECLECAVPDNQGKHKLFFRIGVTSLPRYIEPGLSLLCDQISHIFVLSQSFFAPRCLSNLLTNTDPLHPSLHLIIHDRPVPWN